MIKGLKSVFEPPLFMCGQLTTSAAHVAFATHATFAAHVTFATHATFAPLA